MPTRRPTSETEVSRAAFVVQLSHLDAHQLAADEELVAVVDERRRAQAQERAVRRAEVFQQQAIGRDVQHGVTPRDEAVGAGT